VSGEPGLVALDPRGLAELESTLQGVAEVYRSQAGRVLDVLSEVGESGTGEAAQLHALADWCRRHRDDVARRRLLVAALPAALPLPPRTFETRSEGWRAAEAQAGRLRRALDAGAPSWSTLAPLLAEAARGAHDGAYAARFLTLLGPERTAALPLAIDRAAGAAGAAPEGDDMQAVVAGALLRASRHQGPGRLSERWIARFTGPAPAAAPAPSHRLPGPPEGDGPDGGPEALLGHLGFGTDLARAVALGLGAGRLAMALRGPGTVLAVVRLATSDDDVDGWDLAGMAADAGATLGLALVTTGVVATPLGVATAVGASIVASALGWLAHQVEPARPESTPEAPRRRNAPAFDPDTGTTHYPGGGQDRPHQDGAGGVLPPSMVR